MFFKKRTAVVFYCVIERDDKIRDMHVAYFPDVPSVSTFGFTRYQAIRMARKALRGCLRCDKDRGILIPESKFIGNPDCRIEVRV